MPSLMVCSDVSLAHRASPEVQSQDTEGAVQDGPVCGDVLADQEAVIDAEVQFRRRAGVRVRRDAGAGELPDADDAVEVGNRPDLPPVARREAEARLTGG